MARKSLYEALAEIPDPRYRKGRRHPLPAILTLLVVAMLSGHRHLLAVAEFGRNRPELAKLLGFTHGTPCCASLHYLLKALDAAALERAIARWLGVGGGQPIAIDGKTLAGSADGDLPGLHLLTAYAPEAQEALASLPVDAETNEHKRALQLLQILPVAGSVVTGDAMFCQRDLSEKVLREGGITAGRSRTTSPS